MEKKIKRSVVKIAQVTPTNTVNEFQMGEILTPTDEYGCSFSSIAEMHQHAFDAGNAEHIEAVAIAIQNQRGVCYKLTGMNAGFALECAWLEEEDIPADIYEAEFSGGYAGKNYRGDWRDMLDLAFGDYQEHEIGEVGIAVRHIRLGKEIWPRNPGESDYAMVSRIFRSADNAQDLWVRTAQGSWVIA